MYKLVIKGGIALNGTVKIAGSKNAALPILFASILADGPITLTNTPHLSDVSTTLRLLMDMGGEFILESDSSLHINASKLTKLMGEYNLGQNHACINFGTWSNARQSTKKPKSLYQAVVRLVLAR
jgi:UDP-N-acetylglucosamine 1-carboxyvinyltransferase